MSKQVYVYGDYLMHHGIKGQEWGEQNGPPYPLNPQKDYSPAEKKANKIAKKHTNKDGTLKKSAEKDIRKRLWTSLDNDDTSKERNQLGKKMNDELQSTKEAKAYNSLVNKRGIVIRDKNGNVVDTKLSYMGDDWSDPEKVVDQMVKDMEIEKEYHAKDVEITNKYLGDWCGAVLKDLGYADSKANRQFLLDTKIVTKYS